MVDGIIFIINLITIAVLCHYASHSVVVAVLMYNEQKTNAHRNVHSKSLGLCTVSIVRNSK
jgi:hypothetical protein